VARKSDSEISVRSAAEIAAARLRPATMMQLAGLKTPAQARKIPMLRRRLTITIPPSVNQPVIIRHTIQNVGSPLSEIQPLQSPRA
jgi:hypothetical protein